MESITKQAQPKDRDQIVLPSAISINSQWELAKDAKTPAHWSSILCSREKDNLNWCNVGKFKECHPTEVGWWNSAFTGHQSALSNKLLGLSNWGGRGAPVFWKQTKVYSDKRLRLKLSSSCLNKVCAKENGDWKEILWEHLLQQKLEKPVFKHI